MKRIVGFLFWIIMWCLMCMLLENTYLIELELPWVMVYGIISMYICNLTECIAMDIYLHLENYISEKEK